MELENLLRDDPSELAREYYRTTGNIGMPAGTEYGTLIKKILDIEFQEDRTTSKGDGKNGRTQ